MNQYEIDKSIREYVTRHILSYLLEKDVPTSIKKIEEMKNYSEHSKKHLYSLFLTKVNLGNVRYRNLLFFSKDAGDETLEWITRSVTSRKFKSDIVVSEAKEARPFYKVIKQRLSDEDVNLVLEKLLKFKLDYVAWILALSISEGSLKEACRLLQGAYFDSGMDAMTIAQTIREIKDIFSQDDLDTMMFECKLQN